MQFIDVVYEEKMAGIEPVSTLEKLILLKPEASWDWNSLTHNPAVRLPFIEAHPELPWDFYTVGLREDLTDYYAEKFLDTDREDALLGGEHSRISAEFLFSHYRRFHNGLEILVSKPDFRPEMALRPDIAAPEEIWELLPLDFLLANQEQLPPINYEALSANATITEEFIESNLDQGWLWGVDMLSDKGLSTNPAVTLPFIERHIDREWDWGVLGDHPCMTEEFIESHPELSWQWEYIIASNTNFSLEFFLRNLDKNLSGNYLTETLLKTQGFSVLLTHTDVFPWNWSGLTITVPMRFINAHPELPWIKVELFKNPGLTVADIYRHDLTEFFGNPVYKYVTGWWAKNSANSWRDIRLLHPLADLSYNPFITVDDIISGEIVIPYENLSKNWFERSHKWWYYQLCKLQHLLKKTVKEFRRRRAYMVVLTINKIDHRLRRVVKDIVVEYL